MNYNKKYVALFISMFLFGSFILQNNVQAKIMTKKLTKTSYYEFEYYAGKKSLEKTYLCYKIKFKKKNLILYTGKNNFKCKLAKSCKFIYAVSKNEGENYKEKKITKKKFKKILRKKQKAYIVLDVQRKKTMEVTYRIEK